MKRKFLLLGLFCIVNCALFAQTYKYNFNNSFTEAGAIGPTLTEVLDATCTPAPTPGAFVNQAITTAGGPCGTGTPPAFNFNKSGGISFANSSFITGGTGASYTIHILFKFNSILPNPSSNYKHIIDFSDGTQDCSGLYVFEETITSCQAQNFFPPNFTFASNIFTLCSIVRDGGTNLVSIYFDGNLRATISDVAGQFAPLTSTTPITLFRDDIGGCEDGAGTIKYFSIAASTSTALQVSNEFTSVCSSTLPLRLIDFTASKQTDNSVLLKWITDNEENTSHFELERSTLSANFSKISTIATNNITARNNYNFIDRQPLSGVNYYRLKIFDKNGDFKYSNILKISFNGKQPFEVYPNPAKNVITINGVKTSETVKLVNTEGKILQQKISNGQSITMDVSRYPTGVYIVTYFDGEQTQRQKIVKQ